MAKYRKSEKEKQAENQRIAEILAEPCFAYTTHLNSPAVDVLTILERTEKAIKVETPFSQYPVWTPITAWQISYGEALTLKVWFRKRLKRWQAVSLGLVSRY